MSGWEELGLDPEREATDRHLILLREQWDDIKAQHDWQAARLLLAGLPTCKHDPVFVRVLCVGGSTQVKRQCRRCFWQESSPVKHNLISEPIDSLPLRIQLNYERIWAAKTEMQQEVQDPGPKHTNEYLEHITSDKWRGIRARVLSRCGGICEGCLTNRATEVHHMNYLTLGDELCYDLRGLCSTCHEKADELRKNSRR